MKKQTLLAFAFVALFFAHQANAQNADFKSNASVGLGFSGVGALFSLLNLVEDTLNVTASSFPAIQASYDYAILGRFSVGLAVSFQSLGFDINDYTYLNLDGVLVTEDITSQLNRLNIGIRPLIHYGKNEKFDLYSGARLGITNWSGSFDSTDPDFEFASGQFSGIGFSAQVIPFGFRGYLTENIGLGAEIAIGAPHFFAVNGNYRF